MVNLLQFIKLFGWFRNQFPPAPVTSSIPHWQLSRAAKLQTDKQMGVNSTDTLNSSLPNIGVSAAFKNASSRMFGDNDINNANGNHLVPNEAMSLMSSDQNINNAIALVDQSDHSNHII